VSSAAAASPQGVSAAVDTPSAAIPREARSLNESHWVPGIEVLRAVAASVVVIHHTYTLSNRSAFHGGNTVEGFGGWGVDLFFLLSSFLLCEYFWRPRERRSIVVFYIRRVLRIAPAYYAVVAILFLFLANHATLFSGVGVAQVIASFTFTQWLTPGTSSSLNVDGALWTLTVEMILYLFIPLMALAVWKKPLFTVIGLVAFSSAYRVWIALSGEPLRSWLFGSGVAPPETTVRLFLGRQFVGFVSLFALGMGVRYLLVTKRFPQKWIGPLHHQSALVILALLLPSAVLLQAVSQASDYHNWFAFTFYDLGLGLMAVPALVYASRPVTGSLSLLMRAGLWVGKRSYGLYLWHFPIVLSVYGRGPLEGPPQTSHLLVRLVIIWVLALGLASASYSLIEKPAMEYAKKLGKRWVEHHSAAAAATAT
jgi:peptidoglycan/LPS O-acetylase OafA/YrhL